MNPLNRLPLSLTFKFIVALSVVFVLGSVVFVFFAIKTGRAMLDRQALAKAEGIANVCLNTVEEIMLHHEHEILDDVLALSVRANAARDLVFFRADSTVRSPSRESGRAPSLPIGALAGRNTLGDTSFTVVDGSESSVWLIRPVTKKQACRSCHTGPNATLGQLAVNVSIDDLRPISAEHRRTNIAMVSLVFVLLAGATLIPVTVLVVRPVNTLRTRMRQLTGQLRGLKEGRPLEGVSIPERHSCDEVAELTSGFNEMVRHLNEAYRSVRAAHESELQEAYLLASIGERAAHIVHDVRNPIMGVLGALQVIQGEGGFKARYEDVIKEMQLQMHRTASLLSDLLACARPQEPVFDAADLNEAIRSTVIVLAPRATTRSITITTMLDPSLPHIEADARLLQQLIWNILSNAVMAERDGGTISIRTSRQPSGGLEHAASQGSILLTIRDTGRGMSAVELEQAFRPFYTTREGGSGLGLTISRRIVEQHGGIIVLDSVQGEGTTVTVELPLGRRREE